MICSPCDKWARSLLNVNHILSAAMLKSLRWLSGLEEKAGLPNLAGRVSM